jgi:hypothetical protein
MFHLPPSTEDEWEVREQPVGRRLERGGGQRAVEVGLVEACVAQISGGGVRTEPTEGQLVGHGEQHQRVRREVPVAGERGMRKREVQGGVYGLTGLRPRRKVGAGDDVEAALAVWHGHECTWRAPASARAGASRATRDIDAGHRARALRPWAIMVR